MKVCLLLKQHLEHIQHKDVFMFDAGQLPNKQPITLLLSCVIIIISGHALAIPRCYHFVINLNRKIITVNKQ